MILTSHVYFLRKRIVEKSWVFHNFPEAPLPPNPRGRGLCAEEETASALRPSPSSLSKKK